MLGEDVRLVPIVETWGGTRQGNRVISLQVRAVDLSDPLAEGLFTT